MMTIARYTLIEALRSKVLWLALLLAVLGFGFSLFLQQISVTESRQIQSGTLAMTYRLGAIFILCSFVVSGMLRDYHDKSLEFFLAMPMSRASYCFGRLAGYAACSLILAMLLCIPLLWSNAAGTVLLWGVSLFLELALMGSVSFFFAVTLTQAPFALAAVFGFYLLARAMGTLILIVNGPLAGHDLPQRIGSMALSAIGFLLPRLDEFTRTAWLVYPGSGWHELLSVAIQTAIYSILVSSAALFDFYRREL